MRIRKVTIKDVHESLTNQITKNTMDTREWLGGEIDRLRDELTDITERLTRIHPVHVDMSQKLADALLDRMRGPLTIPQEASDWLKECARGGPFQWTSPLGYSSASGTMHTKITPEGTIYIELRDINAATFWRGEFTPPGYREAMNNE